ncbi:MAG: N-sulfoglucosamine sulfohydrolase [Algoriphagus sp.]|jgi:N-sulfoglucosamine sulfohydrolase
MKLIPFYFTAIPLVLFLGCQSTPQEQRRPNILFAISDDQSFAHTSYNGSEFVKTPAFDRIAREGIYFTNCYAGSPGCAPSRSSIVTGRHHWQNEQAGQHASTWLKKYIPFVDLIEKNGYSIGRTGKGVGPFQYASTDRDSLWRTSDAAGISHSNLTYEANDNERFAKGISNINYFENFRYFLDNKEKDKPFFFWFGGKEPHRAYEKGSWKKMGKKLTDAQVPRFLPDVAEVRSDMLDYAVEIEWFDLHLKRMLEHLEKIGELENTIIIVTSDNGMPFPRAKANSYEYGIHVPLAIRYPKYFSENKRINAPVSFVDIAPTILDMTHTSSEGMLPITGISMLEILEGSETPNKDKAVFSGRERHSSSRYLNWGYPQRSIRKGDYLLIWNIRPERWPAGAPQKFDANDPNKLLPMYGLDKFGKYIPQGSFTDIDDCPTKTYLVENHKEETVEKYFNLAVGKRPEFQLFNIADDPYCMENLSELTANKAIEEALKTDLINELTKTNDPRLVGPDKAIFDTYKRYSSMRKFPNTENMN